MKFSARTPVNRYLNIKSLVKFWKNQKQNGFKLVCRIKINFLLHFNKFGINFELQMILTGGVADVKELVAAVDKVTDAEVAAILSKGRKKNNLIQSWFWQMFLHFNV